VAALLPPAALVAAGGAGPLRSLVESVVGAAQHKSALLGDRLHAAAELATGQKLAAVAASAAALAGGGTAIDEFANHQGPQLPEPVQQVETQPVQEELPVESEPAPVAEAPASDAAPEPVPAPAPEPAPPPPAPADEFAPGGQVSEPASAPPPQQQAASSFTPAGAGGGRSPGEGGEFAP
jgi:outer membrane biosynthesis protein TonB